MLLIQLLAKLSNLRWEESDPSLEYLSNVIFMAVSTVVAEIHGEAHDSEENLSNTSHVSQVV